MDEGNLQIVREVATPSALAAPAAEYLAEQTFEDVAHRAEVAGLETSAAAVERRMTESVVLLAAVRVTQDGIRFACLFEGILGRRVIRVAVGVVLHR